jgi:diguanylate cyclase (GGDEF)-like protein
MDTSNQPDRSQDEEGDGDRMRGTINPDAVPVDLVSAFAGDRAMTATEADRLRDLQERRGNVFFSDLIYAISHHYFAPELAQGMWNQVLAHKLTMSTRLGRNVRITVATLDYLSNITGEMKSSTLMSEASVAEIVNLSMRDGMTGLFNHSTCYELLDLELRYRRRYGVGVALILLDIDDFKSVNDRCGHQAGDRILIGLARTLQQETRHSDICCRFGGEEFAVILPFTNDQDEALGIAERIRSGAARMTGSGPSITISAGLALCDGITQTSHALVERADRALYRAKRNGKNQVVVSDVGRKPPGADPR